MPIPRQQEVKRQLYSYGSEVLAVADARFSDLKDSFPDNIGLTERKSRAITLDNIVGNYVILDLGHGRFALYAHLQPGSLRVKVGDKVKTGQVLALVGNSGNSDAPHLHFQGTDANSPMGSEGVPYEFEIFTHLGVIDGPDLLDAREGMAAQDGREVRRSSPGVPYRQRRRRISLKGPSESTPDAVIGT
jgi:Peptidase family M23